MSEPCDRGFPNDGRRELHIAESGRFGLISQELFEILRAIHAGSERGELVRMLRDVYGPETREPRR